MKQSYPKILFYYEKFMIIIGFVGQALFYLQAYEIYKKQCADNVSLPGFVVSLFSLVCWLVYGILKKDKVLIIVNALAVIGSSFTLITIILYS